MVLLHIFKGKKATQATVAAANVDLQGDELWPRLLANPTHFFFLILPPTRHLMALFPSCLLPGSHMWL